MKSPEEPLAVSAPLALRMAPTLCRRDPETGESCAWNHAPWQLFRLMGLVMTPALHADFYRGALATLVRAKSRPRVLISAAADYCMLAQALAILRSLDADPEVTVVDVCETPLMLNRWYAERVGCPVRTCRSDILEYRDDRPFDLVCTHSFLGRFTREQRVALLARWRDLLRPGGAAITVNRVQDAPRVAFTEEQSRAFRATVLRAAESLRGSMEVDLEELARQVDAYVSHPAGHPVRTREEFLEPFERAGFALEHVSCAPVSAGVRRDVEGPRVPGDAVYGRIIAIRR